MGWRGVLEGFYGQPFAEGDRLELVAWCGRRGIRDYVYSPKGDPLLRDSWREPIPAGTHLVRLVDACREAGVRLSVCVSPGLDWQGEPDHGALTVKLQALLDLGVHQVGVAWDDVPRGGAELGASHAAGVSAAVLALPPGSLRATCPTDYSASTATAYLRAFCDALAPGVEVFWTGPAIVSPRIPVDEVRALTAELGRTLVLADNFPVNDGPMSGVLHLGPPPPRDPELPSVVGGLLLNLMELPLASRIGVDAYLRWWDTPTTDPEHCWQAALVDVPGIEPLARAACSWLTSPGPDPELLAWAEAALSSGDRSLEQWLARGCREGLAASWQSELEPWLVAWEWQAFVINAALESRRAPAAKRVQAAFLVGEAWRRAQSMPQQLFGTRFALYPVTAQQGDEVVPRREGLVRGETLLDLVCRRVLAELLEGTS
ncbi:MAG: hyaluronoglucosaminidase [Frankiaceae bacterium]|nr:hyaluronoglucosaminidase [Frankiaceae bacterium]